VQPAAKCLISGAGFPFTGAGASMTQAARADWPGRRLATPDQASNPKHIRNAMGPIRMGVVIRDASRQGKARGRKIAGRSDRESRQRR